MWGNGEMNGRPPSKGAARPPFIVDAPKKFQPRKKLCGAAVKDYGRPPAHVAARPPFIFGTPKKFQYPKKLCGAAVKNKSDLLILRRLALLFFRLEEIIQPQKILPSLNKKYLCLLIEGLSSLSMR